jgi:hypothetical protein
MATTKVTSATAVYVTMMLVFATGMWAVLVFGSTLRAPPDLAGEWELLPEGDPRAATLHATLEQSGRFVRLRIHGGETCELRMVESTPLKPGAAASRTSIRLAGKEGIIADFEATPANDVYRLTLDDSQHRVFTARLVTRAYPRTTAAHPQEPKP